MATQNEQGGASAPSDIAAIWRERMDTYLCRDALYRADTAFGDLGRAYDEWHNAEARIEATYGRNWRDVPEAKAAHHEAWEVLNAAEEHNTETFLKPLWAAQRALVETPAPDIDALRFKVDLIDREEVWNDAALPREAMAIVDEDAARLMPQGR